MPDSTMPGGQPRVIREGPRRTGSAPGTRPNSADLLARTAQAALGCAVLLAALGCASHESPEGVPEASGPLPYQVGVYLDTETLSQGVPEVDEDTLQAHYLSREDEILEMVYDSLSGDPPVVGHAVRLRANTREAALREARGLDLLVGVGFETAAAYTELSYSAGWGVLEVITFVFGGVPSWFVPTVAWETPARLTVGVIDLHQPEIRAWQRAAAEDAPAFDWTESLNATSQSTSFVDRTRSWTDYFFVLFVPPMVIVPGEVDRLSATLTEGVNEELSIEFATMMRDRLLSQDWVRRLAVSFLDPDPMRLIEGEDIALSLGLANRQGGGLRRLEVVRRAPGAPEWRWRASPADLEMLDERFRALEDPANPIRFEVPERIPVAEGGNLVKVLLVHETGEQIVRTMLYVR